MEPSRLVVLATVRNRLQAEVMTSELARRDIRAEYQPRLSIVRVPETQLEQARAVVAELTGRGAQRALLDLRRLIPAILILVALIVVISWIVDLFV